MIGKSTYAVISNELTFKVFSQEIHKPGTGVKMHTVKKNWIHIS